ncbi:MAG: hypothetical protein KBD78_13535 [Oligoflexales bacterium]|nr:hypothetical protein [Oligoflexales bacterium]
MANLKFIIIPLYLLGIYSINACVTFNSVDRNAAILVEKNKKTPPYWQHKPKFSDRGQSYVVISKLKQQNPDEIVEVTEDLVLDDIYYEKYSVTSPSSVSTVYYYDIYYKYKNIKTSR